jgi:cytochrome c oxidase assembly factor CtaG
MSSLIDRPITLALLVVGLLYVRGWIILRRADPAARSGRQLAAFAIGLSALWLALGSPLAALHHELLTVHMVQHVLLMAVAPPLILVSAPLEPLVRGIPSASVRSAWRRLVRRPSIRRARAAVLHPVVCWLAPVAALMFWHVPAVFELALHSPTWHAVQAASFLVTGLLFWAPVVRPSRTFGWPRWSIPLYLFAATLPCDALSAFLTLCGRVVYPVYLSAPRVFDVSPLRDQELAGSFMWVAVTLIYLVPASAVTLQLLSPTDPGRKRDSTLRGPDPLVSDGAVLAWRRPPAT